MKNFLIVAALLPTVIFARPLMINNQTISPACIAQFNPGLLNPSFITQVNADTCQHAATLAHGMSYKYDLVGTTTNGISVLNTYMSTGGSGVFQTLLLVKLSTQTLLYNQHKTTYNALTLVGTILGGDRFSGSYHDLSVVGNKLIGFKYSSNNPAGVKKYADSKVRIDL